MRNKAMLFFWYVFIGVVIVCAVLVTDASVRNDYIVKEYVVEPGDTYDVLADKFSISEDICVWRERVKMINDREGSGLFVGEKIFVYVSKGE